MVSAQQELFCKEYIVDGNPKDAALRAGYAEKTARYASKWLGDNPLKPTTKFKPALAARIAELMAQKDAALIAKGDEVLKYLTSVMRGESESEIVVVEGCGDGMSSAVKVQKAPDEKERLKAAELLGKRYGLYTENVKLDGALPVIVDNVPGKRAPAGEGAGNG